VERTTKLLRRTRSAGRNYASRASGQVAEPLASRRATPSVSGTTWILLLIGERPVDGHDRISPAPERRCGKHGVERSEGGRWYKISPRRRSSPVLSSSGASSSA
jgi:hypothetical protein